MTLPFARYPYIGITGFMRQEEIREVLSIFPDFYVVDNFASQANFEHLRVKLMAGILVSSKTMNGIPNRWPNRYPLPDQFASIPVDDPRVLNLAHFNTKNPDDLFNEMRRVHELFGWNRRLDGFQLNLAWPNVDQVRRYWLVTHAEEHPKYVVLQVGEHAFDMVDHDPKKLADKVAEYAPYIDYVLLDPSGGLGKNIDMASLDPYLEELYSRGFELGYGVAGGLCSGNLEGVRELLKKYPYLSWDAEGKLRGQKLVEGVQKDDQLLMPEALAYVAESHALYGIR